MDIVNHAVAGAAAGSIYGQPVLGALVAIVPDLMLFGPRRDAPPLLYDITHSLLFTLAVGAIGLLFGTAVPLLALVSHLLLDLPTHGPRWAPVLGWPLSRQRYSYGEEWEWFSKSWWRGLALTAIWSGACLVVSLT